ncbi:MAG: oxidoreductase [Nevskiales bacterium]|nr:oxidoreductase [Nevskiales bacterium]
MAASVPSSERDTVQWCAQRLPDLSGKRALVTGAASGLGLETATGLASRGATVILADRNVVGGHAAAARIRALAPGAEVEFRELDLADLARIRQFASELDDGKIALDILVNNAGILPPLQRRTTADGFELKFGINVLGHFALTGLLLDALRRAPAPRVVWVSSLVHRHARIDFDDVHGERDYAPQRAYNQAKLACLMLAMALDARVRAAGIGLTAVAAHPGVARTPLGDSRQGQPRRRITDHLSDWALWVAMTFFGQAPGNGARPILYAAAGGDVDGGSFWGPDGFGEMSGEPTRVKPSAPALDDAQCARLWTLCEAATGLRYLD